MRLNLKPTVKAMLKTASKPDKKDELWDLVKNYLDEGLEARRPFEARWALNLAFLAGRQYAFFNMSVHTLNELKRVKGRVRNIDNQLLPRWRRQVADLVKTAPQMSVVPNTNESEDIAAAKIGDKVLKHFYRVNQLKKKVRQLAGWIYSCGNGFMDDRWNGKLGPTRINTRTGEMEYQGDVDVGVWSPFEIVVPPLGFGDVELDALPWIVKRKFRDLSWIANNYKRGKEVVSEQVDATFQNVGLFMRGRHPATERNPGAFVNSFYLQPCTDFKKGLYVVAANGIVLEKGDFPYREYNLEHFKDIDVPGQFYGKATMEDAVPRQRTWNNTISSIEEFNRTMGKGKWLSPRRAKMAREPDDTHGEVLSYNPVLGHKPELVTLKGLPQTYQLLLDLTKVGIEDLFSQHEVSRGTNRSDIRSGEMVSILREQDAHGNIPTHLIFEESFERLMGRVLKRIAVGYKEDRMIKIVGRENEFEIFAFRGADLRNNTDVHVKRQSSQSDSRIAREATVLRKFELGLFGNPADPEVRRHVMNMLEDAVVEDLYSDTRLDESYARYENEQMLRGVPILINDYDDHRMHLKEHNHFRKRMDFQKVKMTNPKMFVRINTVFTRHNMMHQKFIARQEAEAMRRMAMMEQMGRPGRSTGKGAG